MIDLRALGALDLRRRDGPELHSVLAQPKRTGLLCYLALARPRGFHRRDSLVALFWPEHDTEHARASLRQAIHFLRRSLGEDAILSRGDEDLGLGEGVLCCDAVQFDAALDAGDPERALSLYGGDLLPGFFVEEAPEFERWLEAERTRLRDRAIRACWSLAESCERSEERAAAAEWGRRAIAIAPADDSQIIRLMQCLARSGDRAGALAAFDTYARRLRSELEVEPTAAAQAVAEQIRAVEPPAPASPGATPPRKARAPENARVREEGAAPRVQGPVAHPGTADEPSVRSRSPERRISADVEAPAGAPPLDSHRIESEPPRRPRRFPAGRLAVAASGFALVVLGIWLSFRSAPEAISTQPAQGMAVLYFKDLSPDGRDRSLAAMLTEMLIEQFSGTPGLKVISAPGVEPFRAQNVAPDSIGRALNVGLLVWGTIQRDAGRIRVRIELLDARTATALESRLIERPVGETFPLVDDVAREAAVFLRRRIGEAVQLSNRPAGVSDAAWRLFQEAKQNRSDAGVLLLAGERNGALADFRRADSLLAAAERTEPGWTGLAVERAGIADRIVFVLRGPWPGRDTVAASRALERGIAQATRALSRERANAALLEARAVLLYDLWYTSAVNGRDSAAVHDAAEADARAAVAADPHRAAAWSLLAAIREDALDFAGAQAAATRALQEDAYASDAGENLWRGYVSAFQLGQDGRAREWCDELRRRNRSEAISAACALQLEAWGSQPPNLATALRARAEFGGRDNPANDMALKPVVDLAFAAVLARAGLPDSAEALIRQAVAQRQSYLLRWEAEARVLLHQDDVAIRLLAQYLRTFPHERGWIASDRCYASLHQHPEFVAITAQAAPSPTR